MRPWTVCLPDALAAYHDPNRMMVSFYVKDSPKTDDQVGCLPSGAPRASGFASFNDRTGSSDYIECLIRKGYGKCKDSPTFDVGSPGQYEPYSVGSEDIRATTGVFTQGDAGQSNARATGSITAVHDLLGAKGLTMSPKTILLPTAEYWEKNEGTWCSGAPGIEPGCYEGFGAIRAEIHGYWFDTQKGGSSFSAECVLDDACSTLKNGVLANPLFSKPNPSPFFMIFWKYAGPNWVSKVDLTAAPGNLCFDQALCNIAAGLVPLP